MPDPLNNHKQNNSNSKKARTSKWWIPFSAIVLVLLPIARNLPKWLHMDQDSKLRQTMKNIERRYEENVQKSNDVIKAYTKNYGPIYVFTNDPNAEFMFLPKPKLRNYMGYGESIEVLKKGADNKYLEEIIRHPENSQYILAATNPRDSITFYFNKVLSDSASIGSSSTIYFAVYNANKGGRINVIRMSDTTGPIHLNTSISIPKSGVISKQVLKHVGYSYMSLYLREYEGTYFYMVGEEQDGITKERFEKIKMIVIDDLKKEGINMTNFKSKSFNTP